MKTEASQFVILFACEDRMGIVAAVANSLAAQGCNILENAQYGDGATGRFFMRVKFTAPPQLTVASFTAAFAPVAAGWQLDWKLHDLSVKPKAMIMVSKGGHCLNDLLYRTSTHHLPMEITSVVSNHATWQRRVEHEGLQFHHLPVTAENRAEQEAVLLRLIDEQQVDLVILARYMQVLSDAMCRRLDGRVINIHHSFLPGFKGANPYARAYERVSRWSARLPITSPPTSMKDRSSRRTFPSSTTPTASRTSSARARRPRAMCWRGRSRRTSSTGCC